MYASIGAHSYGAAVHLSPTVGSEDPSTPVPSSVSISVSPSTAYLYGVQSQQFRASVTGSPNQNVAWSIVQGPGYITNGVYYALNPVSSDTLVTISATSNADPTKTASATVLLEPPMTGSSSGTVTGSSGTSPVPLPSAPLPSPGSGNPLPSSGTPAPLPSAGSLSPSPTPLPPAPTPSAGSLSPAPAPLPSAPQSSTGSPSPVPAPADPASAPTTSVSPATATIAASKTQQFAVEDLPSGLSVTWKLSPALGSISSSGLYTAPSSIASQQTVAVTALNASTLAALGTASLTLAPTSVSPATATVAPGGTKQFAVLNLPSGTTIEWGVYPVGTISATGVFTAPSTVPSQESATILAVTPIATNPVTYAVLGTATVTLTASNSLPPSVSPATATLAPAGTQQFSVLNLPSGTAVTWAVTPAVGTITVAGLYTAPKSVTSKETVTVTAKNSATQAVIGTASLTLTASPASPTSISPATVTVAPAGTKQFSVLNLPSGTNVAWELSPVTGNITASGLYTAPNSVGSKETLTVKAKNSSTQAVLGTASLTLTASLPTRISPSTGAVAPAGTMQFSVVNLPSGTNVTWSIAPVVGSISQSGLYTAPASVPTAQTVTVTAKNSSTQAVLGTSSATLQLPQAPTSVSPAVTTLAPSGTQQFTVQALGAGVSVVWSLSPAIGIIGPSGLYTAPASVPTQQSVIVTAQNSSTQAVLGSANLTIIPAGSTASNAIVYPTDPPYGAHCDGVTDDAPAIQKAIDSLGSTGGTVHLISCSHPYLLNSYHFGRSTIMAYNLLIGSNVTLEGDPGAELLQGPNGMPTHVPSYIGSVVLEFSRGSNPGCFENIACNGGFYPLHATEANSTQVTLSNASRTSLFQVGDYIMIYAATSFPEAGGILPGEPNIVTSVDDATGALSVQYPLARSFSSPYIVHVTSKATWNVGLKNLIVQGFKPLQMYGVFGAVIQGNTFIHDQSYIHHMSDGMVELASVRQVLFQDNIVQGGSGPFPTSFQIPDQCGMNVTFDGDTFYTNAGMDFGSEYAAHITVQNSHMFISGDSINNAGE